MNNENEIFASTTIEELEKENEKLKSEIETLKSQQEKVRKWVASFVKNAEALQDKAKLTLDQNILRLKVYELKLISYYNKVMQKYPVDKELSNLSEFIEELKKVVDKDFFSSDDFMLFEDLKTRDTAFLKPAESAPPSESGFDFFEAMHPDKDLEDLCKELGLMTE